MNIINSKFEDVQNELHAEFLQHLHILLSNKISLNRYNTKIDCAVRISLYFKHLANTNNEGVEFEAHINKSQDVVFEVDLSIYQSNGSAYESSVFVVNLASNKSAKKNHDFEFIQSH